MVCARKQVTSKVDWVTRLTKHKLLARTAKQDEASWKRVKGLAGPRAAACEALAACMTKQRNNEEGGLCGHTLWTRSMDTLCGTHSVDTLCGTHSVGHTQWDTLCGTHSVGHTLWDTFCGHILWTRSGQITKISRSAAKAGGAFLLRLEAMCLMVVLRASMIWQTCCYSSTKLWSNRASQSAPSYSCCISTIPKLQHSNGETLELLLSPSPGSFLLVEGARCQIRAGPRNRMLPCLREDRQTQSIGACFVQSNMYGDICDSMQS